MKVNNNNVPSFYDYRKGQFELHLEPKPIKSVKKKLYVVKGRKQ